MGSYPERTGSERASEHPKNPPGADFGGIQPTFVSSRGTCPSTTPGSSDWALTASVKHRSTFCSPPRRGAAHRAASRRYRTQGNIQDRSRIEKSRHWRLSDKFDQNRADRWLNAFWHLQPSFLLGDDPVAYHIIGRCDRTSRLARGWKSASRAPRGDQAQARRAVWRFANVESIRIWSQ